jgi:hypothetical protein
MGHDSVPRLRMYGTSVCFPDRLQVTYSTQSMARGFSAFGVSANVPGRTSFAPMRYIGTSSHRRTVANPCGGSEGRPRPVR